MKYVLALKIDVGNYYPLTEEFLDIITEEDTLFTLEGIDNFLAKYSLEEIIESIKRSNINFNKPVEEMEIVITYFENKSIREFKTYSKNNIEYLNFDLTNFIFDNINNKRIRNQIKDYFKKSYIPQDLKEFSEIYASDSTIQAFNVYQSLGYVSKRLLKEYAFQIEKKNEDKRKLTKEK